MCASLCILSLSTPPRVLIFILILRNGHREKRKVSPLSTDSWRTRTYLELACQLTDLHSNTEFLLAQAFDFFPMNVVISSFKLPILLCVLRKLLLQSTTPSYVLYHGRYGNGCTAGTSKWLPILRNAPIRGSAIGYVCACVRAPQTFDLQ